MDISMAMWRTISSGNDIFLTFGNRFGELIVFFDFLDIERCYHQ